MQKPTKRRYTRRNSADSQQDQLGNSAENPAGDQGGIRARSSGGSRGPLDNFFDEIRKGSEAKAFVRIKRIVDNERAYLVQGGKVLWSEYPGPEFIEKNWGGGNYLVEYYSGGTEPRDRLPRAQEKIDIEGPAREREPEQQPPQKQPYAMQTMAQPFSTDQLAGQVAHSITQTMAPVLTSLAAVIERMQSAQMHPITQPAAPAPSLLDLTQALKNMQDMMPKPPTPPAPVEPVNQFSQLREILSLAKEFTAPEGGESNPLAFLERAIDKIGAPIIEHMQSERARTPAAISPSTGGQTMPKNQLQQDLDQLLSFCDKGEPAINLVSVAINMIPEHMLPTLLNLPDPVGALQRYDPRIGQEPYNSWLKELIQYMREELSDDTDSSTRTS